MRSPTFTFYSLAAVLPAVANAGAGCKAYPQTASWPSVSAWSSLNETVSGRLIATIPAAAACHDNFNRVPTYNETECATISQEWSVQSFHYADPTSVLWNFWTNGSCLPTTNPDVSCTLGAYPNYVINATSVKHVQAGVAFARENDVRLVIRNTGHDFMGKSSGSGSLSIWTHNFKDIEVLDNYDIEGANYTGGAVKLGSGWQVAELYNYLTKLGRVVVGGECAGVGITGGYIQGGGHGPLATIYGMASDHALSFDLVTADGEFITANATNYPDLFWALRGGGGASWGVVTSVTIKTFPDMKFTGSVLRFNTSDPKLFWPGIEAFHEFAPRYVENDMYVFYEISNLTFWAKPFLAPGKNIAELEEILQPLKERLNAVGVPHTFVTTEFPTFFEAYVALFDGERAGLNMITSSRLIQTHHVQTNNSAITAAFKFIHDAGQRFLGHIIAPGQNGGVLSETSVNPIWKTGLLLPLFNWGLKGNETETELRGIIKRQTEVYTQAMKDVSVGSGTYMNEANPFEPDWQEELYGASYPRLLEIKNKYDPNRVFWAREAVGSELYAEVAGRLCKT